MEGEAQSMRNKLALSALGVLLVLLFFVLFVTPLIYTCLWSIAEEWYGGTLLPQKVSLRWWAAAAPPIFSSLLQSLEVASLATIFTLLLATPAAYAVTRYDFKGKKFVDSLIMMYFIFPGMVMNIGILVMFYRAQLVGTIVGIALGQTLGLIPYAYRTITAAFKSIDPSHEEAAFISGATILQTLLFVVVPIVKPSILASGIICFAFSMTEFTMAVLVGTPNITTLPVRLFEWMSARARMLAGASVIMLILILAIGMVILIVRRTFKVKTLFAGF